MKYVAVYLTRGSIISWQILVAIIGVIIGFFLADKVLEKRGFKERKRKFSISLEELPKYLERKYLAKSAILSDKNRILVGVDAEEVERSVNLLSEIQCKELLQVYDNDYVYVGKQNDYIIYVKGKFLSLKDFAEIWLIIRQTLRSEQK